MVRLFNHELALYSVEFLIRRIGNMFFNNSSVIEYKNTILKEMSKILN